VTAPIETPPAGKMACTVGDLRKAVEGLPDDAQMFINVPGYGEDFAIKAVDQSEQIPVGVSEWPTDKRTVGLEIHLGLFGDGEVW
jgi:hypothetical protein